MHGRCGRLLVKINARNMQPLLNPIVQGWTTLPIALCDLIWGGLNHHEPIHEGTIANIQPGVRFSASHGRGSRVCRDGRDGW